MPEASLTTILFAVALLLAISVLASKASTRFGIPALLLFLLIGMIAGSEGPGGIWFSDFGFAQTVGVVALVFILFSGGLDTSWSRVRPVIGPGLSLATVGVVASTVIAGFIIHWLRGVDLMLAMLIGAVMSSTDAAAVFTVLRSRGADLRQELKSVVELESGSNDPTAVFLTLALIERLLQPETPLLKFAGEFVLQMSVGAAAGCAGGWLAVRVINSVRLDHQGLYPVLTIAAVLTVYAGTSAIGGNGFLAVYAAGMVMGSRRFVHRASLTRFHDGIAWLMQITMFLTLGLLVFPSQLRPVAVPGLLIAVALALVVRPVSVFIALAFTRFSVREKLLVSWCGLRGAVPIILATFPVVAGVPNGGLIFNLVFFVVLVSVLVQGTTIPLAAHWLHVDSPGGRSFETMLPDRRESELVTISVPEGAQSVGKQVVELGLPADSVILLVYRENGFFAPNGATVLNAGDRLMVLTSQHSVAEMREAVETTT